jgi:type III restriction enzyme
MANLQTILDDFPFDNLPPAWTTGDLASFSRGKVLWDYQQAALRHALTALWLYYDGEEDEARRKECFIRRYRDNAVPLPTHLNVGRKRDHLKLLQPYYTLTPAPNGEREIPYVELVNRMGFWMATGSGKTLVIVKLLQLLWTLMRYDLIPRRDVLVLTHREDLLGQLRDHVRDFNTGGAAPHLRLRELREYPEAVLEHPSLLGDAELTVFFYRSDNLSDTQKERIVDFHNYDDGGKWYVLLDEAHKGDKEDSKRQHIYNILSRDGFLFNFSATFTDPRDRLTTAYEFNLASFIQGGYGKHVSLLKQENRAFRRGEEFTGEEKQRIVLQSLLMLAYVAKAGVQLCGVARETLYHRPLLLALVNSVNTEEADLKLFFRELARIGNGEVTPQAFTAAKSALRAELAAAPEFWYEGEKFALNASLFESLTRTDLYRYVFNAERKGAIEVLVRPSNDKELAFKLKSTPSPFALIKIGDSTPWRKGELAGYEIVKGFEDEGFFARLNDPDSTVNLLMGSRSFYEGWDSNRPNVITFINIGTGEEAQKFVLQSVGRGVRIEPRPGRRKRMQSLHNAGEVDDATWGAAKPFLHAVESLFIFGTKRAALETILTGLESEQAQAAGSLLVLDVNPAALTAPHPILIPVFHWLSGQLLVQQREPRKFELQRREQELLQDYVGYLADDRLLLAHHDLAPQQISLLHMTLAAPDTYFYPQTERRFGRVEILVPRLMQYFAIQPQAVTGFKPLEDEINHFKHIRVTLENVSGLLAKIEAVKRWVDPGPQIAKLREQRHAGEIDDDAYDAARDALLRAQPTETFDYNEQRLHIKHLAQHYFLPLLISDADKLEYINHVIHIPSERRFLNQLEEYLKERDNLFKQYDWWLFSRTDETLDRVCLPYYDPTQNRIRDFHPDFVFWLVKGKAYTILFVDPKGMVIGDYQYKIDGYREHFRDAKGYRIFKHGDYEVRVALLMYHDGPERPAQDFAPYWCDSPQTMMQAIAE